MLTSCQHQGRRQHTGRPTWAWGPGPALRGTLYCPCSWRSLLQTVCAPPCAARAGSSPAGRPRGRGQDGHLQAIGPTAPSAAKLQTFSRRPRNVVQYLASRETHRERLASSRARVPHLCFRHPAMSGRSWGSESRLSTCHTYIQSF